jgi:hypothetical protein
MANVTQCFSDSSPPEIPPRIAGLEPAPESPRGQSVADHWRPASCWSRPRKNCPLLPVQWPGHEPPPETPPNPWRRQSGTFSKKSRPLTDQHLPPIRITPAAAQKLFPRHAAHLESSKRRRILPVAVLQYCPNPTFLSRPRHPYRRPTMCGISAILVCPALRRILNCHPVCSGTRKQEEHRGSNAGQIRDWMLTYCAARRSRGHHGRHRPSRVPLLPATCPSTGRKAAPPSNDNPHSDKIANTRYSADKMPQALPSVRVEG